MRSRALPWILRATVVMAVIAIYWPALTGEFVNHDDPLYMGADVVAGRGLSWYGLKWAFTSVSVGHWHPFTWLSHMLGAELFGLNPFGHHLISILLHAANTLLLAELLLLMTGAFWRSWLVALLFAVHPLSVETAAWVAERKGVLSSFFFLLALWAYARYARKPGVSRYLAVILCFVAGLLSKAMVVTLPCVLLLLDYWPLGRRGTAGAGATAGQQRVPLGRLLLEKVPFLALGGATGGIAYLAMAQEGAVSRFPLWMRLENMIAAFATYPLKLAWPKGLAVFYPIRVHVPAWEIGLALGFVILMTLLAVIGMRKRPYLAVGWLWYCVTLFPVSGIVALGEQTMPDRYAYLPMIGLLLMAVWWVADLAASRPVSSRVAATAAGIVLVALGTAARLQAGYWHNSETLFSHAVAVTRDNSLAHNNLGITLIDRDPAAALTHFREAIRLSPNYDDAYANLGLALGKLGRHDQAIVAYRRALLINPNHAAAHLNLALACIGLGRMDEARSEYLVLLRLNPAYAEQVRGFLR